MDGGSIDCRVDIDGEWCRAVLTEEHGEIIGAANQLVKHVTIHPLDGVSQFPIIFISEPF